MNQESNQKLKPPQTFISDEFILATLVVSLGGTAVTNVYRSLSAFDAFLLILALLGTCSIAVIILWEFKSKAGKARRERIKFVKELPRSLLLSAPDSVLLGFDEELRTKIYLSDLIRSRHIHILGATGSGKTESVILNLLRQDVARGLGAIIFDAKGDASFMKALETWISKDRLQIFDLGSENSLGYDPLQAGSAIEAAQRLFSSLTWSEEYYKSKAFSALQKIFQFSNAQNGRNPTLVELNEYLKTPESFSSVTTAGDFTKKQAEKDFADLSGLRDQINTLCMGYLSKILSPNKDIAQIDLRSTETGKVIYFRLQSLMSPQLVSIVGKLLINHLSFLAGTFHRGEGGNKEKSVTPKLTPVYLDEFATFACPEFADLISKARSAGFALHFSHQSIGDLKEVSEGFLNRITDNSGTKIVLRINDPDSAEFFARSFGTKIYQKTTQRITNAKEIHSAEVLGEGTQREAHQFRASPDLFKTLPTGVGSVLIAHGEETPHGASSVFKVRFPRLPELKASKIHQKNCI